jgi:hypothetical protein
MALCVKDIVLGFGFAIRDRNLCYILDHFLDTIVTTFCAM